jgi:putative cell wall-binding protein
MKRFLTLLIIFIAAFCLVLPAAAADKGVTGLLFPARTRL